MTQNLFKQGYIAPRLKPSLQKLWLSITKYSYLKWQRIFSSLRRLLPSSWINVWITRRVSYKKKEELLSQHEHLVHPWPLVVSILLIFLVFMLCFFCVFCSSLSRVLCAQCCQYLWIVHSWLILRFSLSFYSVYLLDIK
jgi:hypothetical protein